MMPHSAPCPLDGPLAEMTAAPTPLALPARLLVLLTGFGALNVQTLDDISNHLVQGGVILATGYVVISNILDKRNREKRRQDLQDEIERMRTLDAARHESLSAQLEEANARAAKAAGETTFNQQRMRQTLHDINNQLNAAQIENEVLRRDLATANANFIRVSEQLNAVNALNADLRDEVHGLKQGVESVCRMEKKAEAKAQGKAEGEGR